MLNWKFFHGGREIVPVRGKSSAYDGWAAAGKRSKWNLVELPELRGFGEGLSDTEAERMDGSSLVPAYRGTGLEKVRAALVGKFGDNKR